MPKPTDSPKLSVALRAARELTGVKVETLATGFVVSTSRMYEVLGEGVWDESYADLRHALATLPAAVADAVLAVALPADVYAMPCRRGSDCDFNHDGRRDAADVTAGLARTVERVGAGLQKAQVQGGRFTQDEAAALLADVEAVRRTADGLRELVENLTLARGLRAAV